MAYKLAYSDYPGTGTGPPDPERWIGPQGPMGPMGPSGPQGLPGDVLGPAGGTLAGPLYYTATGGTVLRSAQDRANDNGYSVLDAGAKGDWDWNTMTGTNDRAVIQALLNNPPAGRKITFPAGRQFYVGTGLVIPADSSLYLLGEDFSGIAYPPTTSGLVCDPNYDCLLIDSAQGCVVENLTCSSSATVQPTYGAGIKVLAGRRISLNRTLCYNTFESYRWEGTSAGGLGGYMREPYAAKVVRAFIVMRTWAELFISGGGRIGNGADWTVPEAHISLEGGISGSAASPNSLSIIGVQMQCQLGPVSFMQFVDRVAGSLAGSIDGINIHGSVMERGSTGMENVFYSDGTWPVIQRFSMTGMYINAGTAAFFNFPATTRPLAWNISTNQLLNAASVTLAPAGAFSLQMSSQQFSAATFSFTSPSTSSTISITGTELIGDVTVAGPWRGLSITGGAITGTLTNTATGGVNIVVPNQNCVLTNDLNIGGDTVTSQVDLRLNSAAGTVRTGHFQSAGVDRVTFGLSAGNNFFLQAHDVTGAGLGNALTVNTTTGRPQFGNPIEGPMSLGYDTLAAALDFKMNGASGQVKTIRLQSAGLDRITMGLSGGNNFTLTTYNAGTFVGNALAVDALTGRFSANLGFVLPLTGAPASATATGFAGEVRIDAGFIYICTATNVWKRVATATW